LNKAAQEEVEFLVRKLGRLESFEIRSKSKPLETTVKSLLRGIDVKEGYKEEFESKDFTIPKNPLMLNITSDYSGTSPVSPHSLSPNNFISGNVHPCFCRLLNLTYSSLDESFRDVSSSFFAQASSLQLQLVDNRSPSPASIEGITFFFFFYKEILYSFSKLF
jgi:hypothetical protein